MSCYFNLLTSVEDLISDIHASVTYSCIYLLFFSCCYENEKGVFPENLFVFDLELPADFKPVNRDGEMDAFYLLPLDKVSGSFWSGVMTEVNMAAS